MSTEKDSQHHVHEGQTARISTSVASSRPTSELNQNIDDSLPEWTERKQLNSDTTVFSGGYNNPQDDTSDTAVKAVLPKYLQLLEKGERLGDSEIPMDTVPDWLDMEKYRRGQKFATEYYFGVHVAEMLSLILLFLYPHFLKPLIYTGKSDTPFKAFKRYLSTVTRIKSWYESDIWEENSKARWNLRIVRDMHNMYRNRLSNLDPKALEEKCTLKLPIWNELSDKLQGDFRSLCPQLESGLCPFRFRDDALFISQTDMADTQLLIISLMVLYPSAFGAGGASEEDLECFVYLWRCIGYKLGIEDRFNSCAGELDTVRQRCRDIYEYKFKPKLRDVNGTWEHMMRCAVEGTSYYIPGLSFEMSLLYVCRLLDIKVPHLEASVTYFQWFMYGITSVIMRCLMRFSPFRAVLNWLLKSSMKRATAGSSSWIRDYEERIYPYEMQAKGL